MYFWHACIVLAETTTEIDDGNLESIIERLRFFIRQTGLHHVPADPLVGINGRRLFQCAGGHNRQGVAHDSQLAIINWIASKLPGSYGLVYWEDDEIPGGEVDGFHVLVVAKGRVSERDDPFLSPRIPVIEDEEPEGA